VTQAGGARRRRVWRWAVLVWAVTVAAGGGLTLWLQDSREPRYGWEGAQPTVTPPLPEDWRSQCPTPSPTSQDGAGQYLCWVRTG
jgi:hypothetical protein